MRAKRLKKYKKVVHQYQNHFNFFEPYQVLVESELLQHSLKHRLNLKDSICDVLGGSIKLMITSCVIQDMRNKGDDYLGAVVAAKRFVRRRCPHKNPISGEECIASVIGENNQHRYCLASQSLALNKKMEKTIAVPIIHFVKDTLVLQPLSKITEKAIEELDQQKIKASDLEIKMLNKINNIKMEEEPDKEKNKDKVIGKKKPKAPNPLSVKKKKKENNTLSKIKDKMDTQQNKEEIEEKQGNENKKRKRKRNKSKQENNKDSKSQKEQDDEINKSTEVDQKHEVIDENNQIDSNNQSKQLDDIINEKQDENKVEQDIQNSSNKKKRKRKPHSHNKNIE